MSMRCRSLAADPTTKNIQYQRNGFGTFVQKFQLSKGNSKCVCRDVPCDPHAVS